MRPVVRLLVVLLLVSCWVAPGSADMVFPARLELVELEAGLFEVRFNLPVQNGVLLKARPVIPPLCIDRSSPTETATQIEYTLTWQVKCPLEGLSGQTVGVDGLLGSRVDVLLNIRTLDGRYYSTVLKPAKSRYVIPEPPEWRNLLGVALQDGMYDAFMRVEVVLLLWLVVLLGIPRRIALTAILGGGLAFAVAQALARDNLLLLPPVLPAVLILLLVLYKAGRMAVERTPSTANRPPARFNGMLFGGMLGVLYGGAVAGVEMAQEWSQLEQVAVSASYNLGVLAALLVLWFMWVEFYWILSRVPLAGDETRRRLKLAINTGILAFGLLLYLLSAPSILSLVQASAPLSFMFMALLLGIHSNRAGQGVIAALMILALIGGLILGSHGLDLPGAAVLVPLTLFIFAAALLQRKPATHFMVMVLLLGALYISAQASLFIQENLSRPVAHVAGNGVLAVTLFLLGRGLSKEQSVRVAGVLGVTVALVLWGQASVAWLHTTVVTDYAQGILRLPLLSLGLLFLALLLWPRRSRVAAHLGVAVRKPVAHLVLPVLAILLVQVGNLTVGNPLFEHNAPGADQAQRIFEKMLSQTYTAFNLEDEEKLYRQLSENVGDNLVEDLYLDSRRRLNSGVREGAEVTVKEVKVRQVGAPLESSAANDSFAYEVEWMVTARVKHLQHIHHRRNSYSGVLKIRSEDGKWKLEQIDLISEDRAIVAGAPT